MPSIADPTQSVIVVVLLHREHEIVSYADPVLFVVRATTLVRYMSSSHPGLQIPWDDWKRDVMVVEIPRDFSHVRTFICGTRVLFALRTHRGQGNYCVQAYDFSRWGCRALVRVGNEEEGMIMPNPKKVWFPRAPDEELWSMKSLGDSLVVIKASG